MKNIFWKHWWIGPNTGSSRDYNFFIFLSFIFLNLCHGLHPQTQFEIEVEIFFCWPVKILIEKIEEKYFWKIKNFFQKIIVSTAFSQKNTFTVKNAFWKHWWMEPNMDSSRYYNIFYFFSFLFLYLCNGLHPQTQFEIEVEIFFVGQRKFRSEKLVCVDALGKVLKYAFIVYYNNLYII